jgi:signal transduction histidine kinase
MAVPAVGLVLASRRPANPIGWLFLAAGTTIDLGAISNAYEKDAEAAVYFCCLEALQNTSKYANPTQACVTLQAQNGALRFTTADDGAGYDSRHTPMGSGLRNMADRLAALGGELDVRSAPGSGTTVTGRLPFPAASPAFTAYA